MMSSMLRLEKPNAAMSELLLDGNKLKHGGDALAAAFLAAPSSAICKISHEGCELSPDATQSLARLTTLNSALRAGPEALDAHLLCSWSDGEMAARTPTAELFWAAAGRHPAVERLIDQQGERSLVVMLTAKDATADGMTLAHHCADSGLVGVLERLAPLLEAAGLPPAALKDGLGRSVLEVGLASKSAASIQWSMRYGTYLLRYRIEPGPAIHRSATCLVVFAIDVKMGGRAVALKLMRHRHQVIVSMTAFPMAAAPCVEFTLHMHMGISPESPTTTALCYCHRHANDRQFEAEIAARLVGGEALPTSVVVGVL
eukprot:SAG11_NODE_9093_length_944_cov_1.423669_1_plen_314_part_11